jgi:hypothetical protein
MSHQLAMGDLEVRLPKSVVLVPPRPAIPTGAFLLPVTNKVDDILFRERSVVEGKGQDARKQPFLLILLENAIAMSLL